MRENRTEERRRMIQIDLLEKAKQAKRAFKILKEKEARAEAAEIAWKLKMKEARDNAKKE